MSGDLPGGCSMVELAVRGDERGQLIAIESGRQAPFAIERVYYMFGTQSGVSRGFHAHRELNQLAIALSGSCRMVLDDGEHRTELRLDDPRKALLIRPGVWREMHDFSEDCVLMVLADAPYDEADYIRSYETFLAEARR